MQIRAEFHCHSTASDGKMSPTDVIRAAKIENVKSIALTDHDTTKGIDEAYSEAKKLDIIFIPGIELSCDYKGATVHLLGYFKDDSYKNHQFQNFLSSLKENRINRAKTIVLNLKKYFDINIDYKKVLDKGKGIVARPHIAQTIIDAGYNYSWDEIFEKFIGDDSPAYVPNQKLDVRDGIKLLKKYNALVILAHPKLIKKAPIEEILSFDLDGVEAIYFQNTKEETNYYISYCMKYNLLITCGSDCHGLLKDDTKHGYIGDMNISSYHYEKFMALYKS